LAHALDAARPSGLHCSGFLRRASDARRWATGTL